MEDKGENLTVKNVAERLRCSTTHVRNERRAKCRECRPSYIWQSVGARLSAASGSISGWKGAKRASMQICQNALSLAQEREFMRRKRFQKGSIRPRKHGKTKVWVGQWWERGQKRSKVLGRVADVPKSEAEAQMSIILKPLNEEAGCAQKPVYTFTGYLEEVFLPLCRREWKESTRMTTEPRMMFHLKPALGGQPPPSVHQA